MAIFLKKGGQLWASEQNWTQVGVATGHSASIADSNWSPARISVSNFGVGILLKSWCFIIFFSIFGH